MKATALADKIELVSETPGDAATMKLITHNKQISVYGMGSEYTPDGPRVERMTIGAHHGTDWDAAREKLMEIEFTERRNASLEHLLAAIPPCPAHGEGCIPFAMEWIAKARTLMAEGDAHGTT